MSLWRSAGLLFHLFQHTKGSMILNLFVWNAYVIILLFCIWVKDNVCQKPLTYDLWYLVTPGESIPIRLFLSGYELTPTMRDVNKKFSVRYYLNLVLVDEEERRYFKQQVSERSSLSPIPTPPPSPSLSLSLSFSLSLTLCFHFCSCPSCVFFLLWFLSVSFLSLYLSVIFFLYKSLFFLFPLCMSFSFIVHSVCLSVSLSPSLLLSMSLCLCLCPPPPFLSLLCHVHSVSIPPPPPLHPVFFFFFWFPSVLFFLYLICYFLSLLVSVFPFSLCMSFSFLADSLSLSPCSSSFFFTPSWVSWMYVQLYPCYIRFVLLLPISISFLAHLASPHSLCPSLF